MPAQVVHATGIEGALAALEALSGKQLEQTTTAVVKKVSQQRAIPIMKAAAKAAMKKPGSHRDPKTLGGGLHGPRKPTPRGKRGPIESTVTVKNIKKRRGEMVAVQVGPRAWYKHFFIGRTKPHVIEARDATGARATSGEVRTINRLEAGYYSGNPSEVSALAVGSRFYARVNHPGTAANPFVDATTDPIARAMQSAITEELLRKTAAAVRTANARSAARRAAKTP
jgi:hypothetical protein